MYGNLCQPTRKGSAEWIENGSVVKKNECGQKKMSVLSVSVSVECGVWSVEYDSAVSGEPPLQVSGKDQISRPKL